MINLQNIPDTKHINEIINIFYRSENETITFINNIIKNTKYSYTDDKARERELLKKILKGD